MFLFLTSKVQLAFNNVCSIAVLDWRPIIQQTKDPAFVEVLKLWIENINGAHYESIFRIELFPYKKDSIEKDTNDSQWQSKLENMMNVE